MWTKGQLDLFVLELLLFFLFYVFVNWTCEPVCVTCLCLQSSEDPEVRLRSYSYSSPKAKPSRPLLNRDSAITDLEEGERLLFCPHLNRQTSHTYPTNVINQPMLYEKCSRWAPLWYSAAHLSVTESRALFCVGGTIGSSGRSLLQALSLSKSLSRLNQVSKYKDGVKWQLLVSW